MSSVATDLFQVMPPLSGDEYQELKADIAARGVMVPIEYDEAGNILDGHHRVKACRELGVKDWPSVVRLGMDAQAKTLHAIKLNCARRHLTTAGKQTAIQKALTAAPEKSDRQLAKAVGVSHPTVATVRKELEEKGELVKFTSSIGADGKERPRQARPAPEPALPLEEPEPEPQPPAYDGSPAYCKYCYSTSPNWRYNADVCCHSGHSWICPRCDLVTADECMDIREIPEPPPRIISIQVAAPSQVNRTAEKATAVLNAAQDNPALSRVVDQMERSGKVNSAHKQVTKIQAAEAISAEPPPMPTGPFRVIVADPPWLYGNRADDVSHRAANPYPSMSIEEICALPVADFAHDDCILWLWTTNAHMRESYAVLDAWGFQSKTILTWVKDRIGTGDWLRGKTEHCHLAIRGKPTILTTGHSTAINGPLQSHSQKPNEFYELVEAICPGAKLEMFCRTPRPDWAVWGNESEGGDA